VLFKQRRRLIQCDGLVTPKLRWMNSGASSESIFWARFFVAGSQFRILSSIQEALRPSICFSVGIMAKWDETRTPRKRRGVIALTVVSMAADFVGARCVSTRIARGPSH